MGLFNFGKPKDEVLEQKIQSLRTQVEIEKANLAEIRGQLKLAKEAVKLENAIAVIKEHKTKLENDLNLLNDSLEMQEYGFLKENITFLIAPNTKIN